MVTSKVPAEAGQERCPLTAALEAIGGKWSLIVLWWLASGTRRFNELRRLMPGISHKVLSATLRDLEREGLVCRTAYPEVPPRVEYAISSHGRTAQPVIEAMRAWGHVHLDGRRSPEAATRPQRDAEDRQQPQGRTGDAGSRSNPR